MKIVGITGGVAMGKSTVVDMLRQQRYRVFDADACVHQLYAHDRVLVTALRRYFPQAFPNKILNKAILSRIVFADPASLAVLENLIHPKVRIAARDFIQAAHRTRQTAIFLDIPLLWSHGWHTVCDRVIVVHCVPRRQRRRVLCRGWDEQRLRQVNARQVAIVDQKRWADFTLSSDRGLACMQRDLTKILANIV